MDKRKLAAGLFAAVLLSGCASSAATADSAELPPLPAPELEEGLRGEQFGIDKNINEATIDQYLGRDDTVYRDMRMLKDEADYEAIGGDAWLSGIVEGFEVVPYPYLVNVEGLPPEVGSTYSGATLFTHDENGYTANYEESMNILEYLFPKDKNIILMCGGGGYAGMTKAMLVELGWDAEKIYNAGGYWFYEGDHAFKVKREEADKTYYDFYKLNYHYIDFATLHRIGEEPVPKESPASGATAASDITSGINTLSFDELTNKINTEETFAVMVYLPGCTSCASFAPVVKEVADSDQIPVYAVNYEEIRDTDSELAELVKYTPAFLLFEKGKVVGNLDAGRSDDTESFKNAKSLSEWIGNYIDFKTVEGTAEGTIEECGQSCTAFGNLN